MNNPTPRDSAQLPPLPEPDRIVPRHPTGTHGGYVNLFTADQMQAYAREALRAQAARVEPVLEVVSWTNGSYHRNYKLNWLNDVEAGTLLYAGAPPAHTQEAAAPLPADVEALNLGRDVALSIEPAWDEVLYAAEIATGLKVERHTYSIIVREVRKFLFEHYAPQPQAVAASSPAQAVSHQMGFQVVGNEPPKLDWSDVEPAQAVDAVDVRNHIVDATKMVPHIRAIPTRDEVAACVSEALAKSSTIAEACHYAASQGYLVAVRSIRAALQASIRTVTQQGGDERGPWTHADTVRIDALARPGWELSQNNEPECRPEELWQVHRVSGGRNDREWNLIGQGETPRAAIDAALATKEQRHG